MWIGGMMLRVTTKDTPVAGTDNLIRAIVVRDGAEVRALKLDYPNEDDLERGAVRNYFYLNLGWDNDQTPQLPPGIGQTPMPYPPYGIEFSHGLRGHLWIKDNVELYTKEIRRRATSFDTLAWQEDSHWTHVANWPQDAFVSTDSSEGSTTWTLSLP
jgi:hypothetical protein